MPAEPLFVLKTGYFHPTASAGSPWSAEQLHGGAPTGLAAREIERLTRESGLQLSRLIVDLLRPVPMAALRVETKVVRAGKRLQVLDLSLSAAKEVVARASALLLRPPEEDAPGGSKFRSLPPPESLATERLLDGYAGGGEGADPYYPDWQYGLHTVVDTRWLRRPHEDGPPAAWIHMPVQLVEGEEPSPLVRAATVADFVNGLNNMKRAGPIGFINADLNLFFLRGPVGEWTGFEVEPEIAPSGLGLTSSVMFDVEGACGRVVQSVLAQRRAMA